MNAMTAKTIREGSLPKRLASIFLAIVAALAISVFVVPATALAADDLTVSLSASSPSGDWTYGSKVKINLSFAYTGSEPVQSCDYQLDIGDKRINDDRVRSSSFYDWCYWDADRVGELTATLHVHVNLEGSAERPEASAEAQFTINKATMTVEAVDYSGKYDGESHEGGATPSVTEGTTVQYSTDGGETWSSTAPSIKDLGTVNYKVKATNPNCYDATDDGVLQVTERTVTLTSATDSKAYDGTPLTNSTVTVGGDGFVSGEGATYDITGAQTEVGSSGNTFTYELDEGTNAANYEIAKAEGTLEVTKAPLTITAKDQEYVYNGKQQGEGDPAYDDPAVIAEKVKVEGLQGTDTVTSITLDGTETAIGVYKGRIKASNAAIGKDGELTGNYDIIYVDGTLTIKAAPEYTVKFVNYDGTVLQSGKVAEGQVPKYEGAEPTRPETAECTYAFSGWEPALAKATKDATYKATFTEKAKKGVYEAVSGAGGTWTEGSSEPLTFTFKRTVDDETTFGHFAGILVDGKAVPEKDSSGGVNWTAAKGSVIVSLQKSYLAKLPAGEHTVTALFDDGDGADASFTIAAKPATHTVTFDANGHGTAPAAQTVEDGEKAKKPSDPTADEYTFGGWYTDKECKSAYDFSTPVTSDVTLYAKWTKKSSGSSTSPRTGDPTGGIVASLSATAAAALCLALLALSRRRRLG